MASEGNWLQHIKDVERAYKASNRWYYTGSVIGSTSAYTFFNFSGTNSGFGPDNNVVSNRIQIVASGGNTAVIQYGIGSNIVQGELWAGETQSIDGKNASGLWIRTNTATQQFRLWAW